MLPKDLQERLKQFKATRHQISRRIVRMDKRLEKEFGKHIAEKRGWHWALFTRLHLNLEKIAEKTFLMNTFQN